MRKHDSIPDRTDHDWVRRLKQGDEEAVHDLWIMLWVYGSNLALRYCRADRANDVRHTAVLEAYKRIKSRGIYQYRFECPFPGYCRVIVVREVQRLMKRQSKELLTTELYEETIGDVDMPNHISMTELRARLQPCLDELNPREQQVIELRYEKECSSQVVADHLDITRNYVNVIAHRARRKLQDCLEGRGYKSASEVLQRA